MKFDGNRAWNDAVRAVSANREVLLVLAGVFFFLPGLAAAWFLSRYQGEMAVSVAAVMAAPKSPAALQQMLHAYAAVAPYFLLLLLIQMLGYMAMLALLTDARRPTVGEAIAIGARSLPALIGTTVIFALAYVLASLPIGVMVVAAMAVLGPQLGAAVGIAIDMAVMAVILTRLSLTLPVIVIEGLHRPIAALLRSWRITSGHTMRLLGFYVMLGVAYVVISIAVSALLNLLAAVTGTDSGLALLAGGIAGLVSAITSIMMTAVLSAIHRQLSGPSRSAISETFL